MTALEAPTLARQAVILAGGKGTRLAARLNGRPKPLIDVDGVPLLERQILHLKRYGIDDVVLLVGHAADQIERYCATRGNFGLTRLQLVNDGEPRGTAGAVIAALDLLRERFLVVYGDTLFNIDVERFVADHVRSEADVTLFLHPNDHPIDSDLVELDSDGVILAFHHYPHPPRAYLQNLVNAAFYVVEKRALLDWRMTPIPLDFGKDLFPAMLERGTRFNGYVSFEYIKDCGTPERIDKVSDHLRRGVVARANLDLPQQSVFIDRDGTLNVSRGFINTPEALELLPNSAAAMKRLNDHEIRVALVTNQPVLARGECSFEGMRRIHGKLDMDLAAAGAFLDRVYVCPHHPDRGFPGEVASLKINCECRKPKPGMLRQAAKALNADLARSWMIGDSNRDALAAQALGVPTIIVMTGEAKTERDYPLTGDVRVADLPAAVSFILDIYPPLSKALAPVAGAIRPGDLINVDDRGEESMLAAVLVLMVRRLISGVRVIDFDTWKSSSSRDPAANEEFERLHKAMRSWLNGGATTLTPPTPAGGGEPPFISISATDIVILNGASALEHAWTTSRRVHCLRYVLDNTKSVPGAPVFQLIHNVSR